MRIPTARCLFCGGDRGAPDHDDRCDGRQGPIETRGYADPPDDDGDELEPGPTIDLEASRAARDVAIASVTGGASGAFLDVAYDALMRVLATQDTFIIDDVWRAMGDAVPPTNDRRAIAGVIMRARREHRIVATGHYRPSAQERSHATPRQIWRRAAPAAERAS